MVRIEKDIYECKHLDGSISYRVVLRLIKGITLPHKETELYLTGDYIVKLTANPYAEEVRFQDLESARVYADQLAKEYLSKVEPFEVVESKLIESTRHEHTIREA